MNFTQTHDLFIIKRYKASRFLPYTNQSKGVKVTVVLSPGLGNWSTMVKIFAKLS